jgi:hypothetical protein
MPVEGRDHVRQEGAQWMVFDKPEPDPVFEQARNKHDGPIESRLEQDRPDQRRAIVVADRPHRVGHQHRFSDHVRRGGSQHEAAERLTVIGKEQVRRQQDQIEADKKIVGGKISRNSRNKKAPARRASPAGGRVASAGTSNSGVSSRSRTGALLIGCLL